jgi:hypothetical protein
MKIYFFKNKKNKSTFELIEIDNIDEMNDYFEYQKKFGLKNEKRKNKSVVRIYSFLTKRNIGFSFNFYKKNVIEYFLKYGKIILNNNGAIYHGKIEDLLDNNNIILIDKIEM